MGTKNDTILQAYQEIRISGLTVIPSPSDDVLALTRLEDMMAQLFEQWNFDVDYNFEESPDLNSQTNVPRSYSAMMAYNLGIRLIPAFNKVVPDTLLKLASGSLSGAMDAVKVRQIREVQPSRRMPLGSGNSVRNVYFNRFSMPEPLPPISAANNQILVGETLDYFEDYSAWLGANTIASYTITVDPRLTLDASANATPRITYTITASPNVGAASGVWQFVKITVTDSAGRVLIRLVNFEVGVTPEVP